MTLPNTSYPIKEQRKTMKIKVMLRKIARAVLAVVAGLGIQSTTHAAGLLTLDHPSVQAVVAVQNTLTTDLKFYDAVRPFAHVQWYQRGPRGETCVAPVILDFRFWILD